MRHKSGTKNAVIDILNYFIEFIGVTLVNKML